jgi:phosphatidylglycerophosphate synthase
MIKQIPNALSISRIFFGAGVLVASLYSSWIIAFYLFIIGLFTDWLDGYLAIKLCAKSRTGELYLDTIGDLGLCAGGIAGLYLAGYVSFMFCMFLFISTSLLFYGIFSFDDGHFWHKLCNGVMPFYYLLIIAITAYGYAILSFPDKKTLIVISYMPVGIVLIATKTHRVKSWLKGGY